MPRRKQLLWLSIALAILVAVALFVWSRDRVSIEQYHRIKSGMSRADVEAILGQPGNYASGPTTPINAPGPSDPPLLSEQAADYDQYGPLPTDYSTWEGDTGQILIRYGPKGVWLKQ
jgi:hypothetical protein